MSLLLIEGCRRSGKTYLVANQDILPVFKFDFNTNFSYWEFDKKGKEIHWFGLGKEIMLHELNIAGCLPKMLVDRGILTNSVWGVFQNRVSIDHAKKDLVNFYNRGLFENTEILLIQGETEEKRNKDIWDEDDSRRQEEMDLFLSFSSLLQDLGVVVRTFHNNYNSESLIEFKEIIKTF